MCNFHVGQNVVCIDDRWQKPPDHPLDIPPNRPVKGRVYTIRKIVKDQHDHIGLKLEEVVNDPVTLDNKLYEEQSFRHEAFRPCKTTSLDVFTAMLAPLPVAGTKTATKPRIRIDTEKV